LVDNCVVLANERVNKLLTLKKDTKQGINGAHVIMAVKQMNIANKKILGARVCHDMGITPATTAFRPDSQ
jgi:hypothetical protein